VRYLITGGSGYIGSRLVETLSDRREVEKIVICDLVAPEQTNPKVEYARADVRDGSGIKALLERHQVDCLIHLAFILDPIHDEARMYDVDVNGTEAVLRAASEAGTQQVLVTSSASAYGAFADNPKPITEEWPVRGAPDFSYARDKAEADRVCQLWAANHPDRRIAIVRPCIVMGPNVDNYIARGWTKAPFMPILDGVDEEFQLVHEDDVVSALIALLDAKASGPYNLAGDGLLTWRRSAELIGLKTREITMKRMRKIAGLTWRLKLSSADAPPGNLEFLRHPWVVSTDKLKRDTDWQPKYDCEQTFQITMEAKGKPFA